MLHFGLIGRNISYSISPELHNKAFRDMGIVADYTLCDIPDLTGFRQLMSSLDGANVTIPYKQEVIPLLDYVSPEALAIGAVNTLYKREGLLVGENTDCDGFMALFDEAIHAMPSPLASSDRVLVLGNGGAAKSVRYVLENMGYESDSVTHTQMDSGIVSVHGYRVVINATPNHRPNIKYDGFRKGKCAIDLTYNPRETEFLREARTRGAITLNGMTMLLRQAEKAREVWMDALSDT